MSKKEIVILLFAWALCANAIAQKDSAYVHRGLLRAGATYAVGTMPSLHINNVYLTGNLEYYTDSKISVRGDVSYFFNSLGNNSLLKQNQQLFFGACYHFSVPSHLDPFIGLQPGIAYVQLNSEYSDPATVSPLASAVAGLNYYADKWFHIMVNVRYVVGTHLDGVSLFSLNEVSFAFGLGFDLDVLKKSK